MTASQPASWGMRSRSISGPALGLERIGVQPADKSSSSAAAPCDQEAAEVTSTFQFPTAHSAFWLKVKPARAGLNMDNSISRRSFNRLVGGSVFAAAAGIALGQDTTPHPSPVEAPFIRD